MGTIRIPAPLRPRSPHTLTSSADSATPEGQTLLVQRARHAIAGWDPLLVSVAVYILAAVGRIHQLFPVLQPLRPAVLAGIAAIVLYLIDSRRSRRLIGVWRQSTTKYLLALLVWIAVSVPGSIWAGNSFDLLVDNFFKTVLMYVVIVGSVRSSRDVERLGFAYFLSAVIYAAVVLTRFDLGTGEAWRLGHLYYYDANDFATFAVSAMPLGLYFARAGRRPVMRLLAIVALMALVVAFVHSGSRGGFLAFLVMGGFVILRYTAIRVRLRVSAVVLAALVLVVTASGQYWRQMGTIVSDTDYNQTAETGRLEIWKRGIGYLLEYPVFGVGANNFPAAEGTLSPLAYRQQYGVGVRWNAPHNSYIQVGAELGFPGLLLFIGLLVAACGALSAHVRRARARRDGSAGGCNEPRLQTDLRQALTASLIGFVVGAFFLSLAYHEMLYTLVALAAGLGKVSRAPLMRAAGAR